MNAPASPAAHVGAGALLSLFTWWQAKIPHPLLPLRVLADRNPGSLRGDFAVIVARFDDRRAG